MSTQPRRVTAAAAALLVITLTACGDATDEIARGTEPAPITVASTLAPTTTMSSATVAPTTTTTAPVTTMTKAPAVFDFATNLSTEGWSVVNDTVMGGVSSGELASIDGMLVFTGELSLDNNGGFASVRSPLIDPQLAAGWADRDGPHILVEGDGRTWTVEVRTADLDGGWIAEMTTSADSITDVTLPWTSFEPVTRFLDPRDTDAPLDPAAVVSIAFYLVDGIEAPFRLGIRSIA